jgi:microcystin-dependent protein
MSEPFLGEIRMFGGNFAPVGWAFCQGQLLSIAQNNALFALVGTTYGGDGVSTFGLPDLQGRVPLHQGQGPGLTNRVLGEKAGVERVTLSSSQMPSHTHPLPCQSAGASQTGPEGGVWANSSTNPYQNGTANAPMKPANLGSSGGNQAHANMMPFLILSFIIALEGIFPSRN